MSQSLSFVGQLLAAREGQNTPEFGGNPYTNLDFSPVEGEVFTLRADGHLANDLSKHIRKDMPWNLTVNMRMQSGKLACKVLSISAGSPVGKAKE